MPNIANILGNLLTDSGVDISTLPSGSGTTNYLPKWTGSTALGNSLVFDNGTSVGVNTTSPSASYLLDVNGAARTSNTFVVTGGTSAVSGVNGLHIWFSGGTSANIEALQPGTSGRQLNLRGYPITFMNSNSGGEMARFTTNGRLLIGTTTESTYELDVVGDIRSTLDANINGLTVGKGGGQILTNTAVGYEAILNSTTGAINNIAQGYQALRTNTTGNNNSALGYVALYTNSVGIRNTAVGSFALQGLNSDNNTGVGFQNLLDVTSGQGNTAIGSNTGRGITTGSYNTIIGASVTGLSASLSNTIILADGQGNQRLYINNSGQAYFKDGWLNIHNPGGAGYNFVMSSDYSYDPYVQMSWGSGLNPLSPTRNNFLEVGAENYKIIARGSQVLRFHTQATERATIFTNGNFAIGTTTDAGYKLDVNGRLRAVGTIVAPSSSFDHNITGRLGIGALFTGAGSDGMVVINVNGNTNTYALNVINGSSTSLGGITSTGVLTSGTFNFGGTWNPAGSGSRVGFDSGSRGVVIAQGVSLLLQPYATNYSNQPVVVGNNLSRSEKFQVDGTSYVSGNATFAGEIIGKDSFNSGGTFAVRANNFVFGSDSVAAGSFQYRTTTGNSFSFGYIVNNSSVATYQVVSNGRMEWDSSATSTPYIFKAGGSEIARFSNGNLLIGTTTDNGRKFQVSGNGSFSTGLNITTTAVASRPWEAGFLNNFTLQYGGGWTSFGNITGRLNTLEIKSWNESTSDDGSVLWSVRNNGGTASGNPIWQLSVENNGSVWANQRNLIQLQGYIQRYTTTSGAWWIGTTHHLIGQGVFYDTTSSAYSINSSAILELGSTTRGFLPPRMTGLQAEAITTPADGLLVYINNGDGVTITSTGFWGRDAGVWVKLN